MKWTTACPDWEERIVARRSLIPFGPLYPDEAEAALDVFKSLRIVDVPGQPTFGQACDEWVFDFVRAIFGAYDAETAQRRIRTFFLLISKKNGKSTIAAAIMLTALIRNWRHSAELLIIAPTLEIAKNSFEPARDMVNADEELRDLLHVQENFRSITHRLTRAVLKVVAADTDTVGGKKAAFVLIDELWIFGKRANASTMLQEATGGLVSRAEGFVIYLSTQSDEPPAGVFKRELDRFRDIRDGKIDDPSSLGVIYEFPKKLLKAEAYLDPANFYITNPNLGRSVRPEWIKEKLQEFSGDAGALRTFLSKHLNVEIGLNLRANRWPGADFWKKRCEKRITPAYLMEACDIIVPGIDGGGLDDLFGLALLGREKASRDWMLWSHAWCHKSVLEKRKQIAPRLLDFQRDEDLTIVDDELGEIEAIVEMIEEVKKRGILGPVAVDPAGIGEFIDALATIGILPEEGGVIGAPQGWALMHAIKTAERKLANGTLTHHGAPLMAWCVGNLKIEPTATGIRASKQSAGELKIDPVIALFNAVTVMSRNPEAKRTPTYRMFVAG